jgi:hypothetical protein
LICAHELAGQCTRVQMYTCVLQPLMYNLSLIKCWYAQIQSMTNNPNNWGKQCFQNHVSFYIAKRIFNKTRVWPCARVVILNILHVSWTRLCIWVWPVLTCPCSIIKCISVCTALWHIQWYTVYVTSCSCMMNSKFKFKWWRTTQITEANILFKKFTFYFILQKYFFFNFTALVNIFADCSDAGF